MFIMYKNMSKKREYISMDFGNFVRHLKEDIVNSKISTRDKRRVRKE